METPADAGGAELSGVAGLLPWQAEVGDEIGSASSR